MTLTEEIWRRRLTTRFKLLLLALLLNPGGGGAPTAPSNFKVIGNPFVRAGGSASLTCHVDPYQDYISFVWVRNAKVIPGQTGMTLNLQSVTKEDAGYYQCGTSDSAILGEGRLLDVFAVGDTLPVPFIEESGVAVSDRNFSLRCLFLEKYIPSGDTVFTWYKDNVEIKGQSGQTLNFTKLAKTDTGAYTCTAWEGDKSTTSYLSSAVRMTPLVSPKVTINKLPSEAHVKGIRGDYLTLNCEATEAFPAVPADGYTWIFSRSSYVQNRSLGEHGSSLLLGPLTSADSGRYFCEARTKKIFANLTLAGQASVIVDSVYLGNLTLTSDQKVNEGDLVTLTCGVDSQPTARLTWTVNGKEVRQVTDNMDHYVILTAAHSDSNNYTCGASNPSLPGREVHAIVQLTVLSKQATGEPRPTATGLHSDEDLKTDGPPWPFIAALSSGFLGLIILVTVLLVICWRKLNYFQKKQLLDNVCNFPPKRRTKSQWEDCHERAPLLGYNPQSPVPKQRSPTLQQTVCFGDVSRNGRVVVLPPVEETAKQRETKRNSSGNEDRKSTVLFVEPLKRSLEKTVRPEDPPVFVFCNYLQDRNVCRVFHKSYGIIIMHVEYDEQQALKNPEATIKKLLQHKNEQEEAWRDQLNAEDVLIVLVVPHLFSTDRLQKIKEKLGKKQIQVLCGMEEADITAWLEELDADKQPWALKREGSNAETFKTAVQNCMYKETYGTSYDPPSWPATKEQARVLRYTDNLTHVWGPPGSGKTLLLLERVQGWLLRGEKVLLAICDSVDKPHVHRLGSLAVRGLLRDAEKRLVLCTDTTGLESALNEYGSSKFNIAIDNIDGVTLTKILQGCAKYKMQYIYTTGEEDIGEEDEQGFWALGGRSFHLTSSLRCTGAILQLANELLPSEAGIGNLNPLPYLSDIPRVSVQVAYHTRHPAYRAQDLDCGECQTWLKGSLSPLKDGLTREDKKWTRWIILLTGDWGSHTNAKEKFCNQLRLLGVPILFDRQLDSQEYSFPTSDQLSVVKPGKAAALKRVETGFDTRAKPAVHMVPVTYFSGLEKACVLVVHYDWRDDHAEHQSQAAREARLREHRHQLHLAVTRCRTELAVLLLSPSPAAAPLLKYVSGGEHDPAGTPVERPV